MLSEFDWVCLTRLWSMMQSMYASCRITWDGFCGLNITLRHGVSLSTQRRWRPFLCTILLQSVYCFCSMEYSHICGEQEHMRPRNTIIPTSSPLRYSMEVVIKAQWLPVDLHTSWTDSLLLGECPWRWQQNCIQELCNEPETYEVVVNHPSSVKCFYKVIQTLWSYNTPSVSAGCRCEPRGHCLQRPTICHPHWQLISEWPDGNLEEDTRFLEELSYTFAFIWSKYSKIVIMWNVTAI